MPRWIPIVVCAAVAGGVAGGDRPATTPGPAVAGPAAVVVPAADPFPIRRVRATGDQLPALLKQLDLGPLVRMPRSEFEARVRAFRGADPKTPPRVTDVRLKAVVANGDLVGTAELDLVNPGPEPQFVPLDPLRVATGPAAWADGGEAAVGIPAGGTAAGVWLDRAGRRTLRFRWSAAGTTELGERRFELRLPPAPTATLDLELPPGEVPTAGADVLLTADPPRTPWRFRFGGRSRLDFAVRPAHPAGAGAGATLAAKYDLAPGQLACRFEYDLRPAKGTVGEWVFAIDPGLRVTDVVANNRAGWGFDPPGPDGVRRLRVSLRQPSGGGKVLVTAVAPFPDRDRSANAPLPAVRPVGAVLDDETWELRFAPGVKPENWSPGDYRVTDTHLLADHTRVVTLTGTLLPPGLQQTFRRPPAVRTSGTEHEFTTTEQVSWRFEPDRVTAVVRVGVRVRRGPLFRLSVQAPPGYTLVRANASADDLITHAGPAPVGAAAEFARPLTAGQTVDLTFEFRGPAIAPEGQRLSFPAFTPIGSAERDGVLGVFPGPSWRLDAHPGAGTNPVGWIDVATPPAPAGAAAAFRYRGDPDGWVTLEPAPPRKTEPGPEARAPGPSPPEPPAPVPAWGFAGLYLVTAAVSPSEVVVVFGGSVKAAGGPLLPVRLPTGAELRSATVRGRWLPPGELRLSADGVLNLPVPARTPARFEVRYRLPVGQTGPVRRIHSPEPELPGEPAAERWWAFGPDVLPGWPVRAWGRGTPADLPPLVGELPVAGEGLVSRSPVAEVRVGSARGALAVGIGFAAGFLALAWAGGRRRHPLCGLLVVGGCLVAGAAVLLAPPWWQRAATVPLVVGLVAAAGMVVARGARAVPAAMAGMAVACMSFATNSGAQSSAPAVVVLLPPDADGKEDVLAPKALLDRLAARPGPGVVLVAADYQLAVDDTTARATARFTAYVTEDAEPVATLPLADARLERATVDGKPAFPTTPRPGVYAVPLPGPGSHEIEVRFAAPVSGTGAEREVKFGVPECPATRLTADLPGTARQPQVVGRLGRLTATTGERVRAEADAGAVKAVQVRWRAGAGGNTAVKVREGCVWEVSESGADLAACYLVRVEQGTVSTLRFELPAELDLVAATVRPLDTGGTAALRDWALAPEQNGFRPLRLDFQGPTAGRVLVVLSASPRNAVTRQPLLRFPRVVLPGGVAEPDAAYGLRAKGVAVEGFTGTGVIDFTADLLARDFAGVAELRLDPNTPVRVFRPVPGLVPELRPVLRSTAEPPGFTLDTRWHVGPHRAEAIGTVRWSGRDPTSLVEFTLPGVRVTEVRGADLAGWSVAAGRVQAWLRRPARDGELTWLGTATPSPIGKPPPGSLHFDPATPRIPDGRLVADDVRVRTVDGWAAKPERERGWTAARTGETSAWRTTNPMAPPVRLRLAPVVEPLRPDELGWLAPPPAKPRPATVPRPASQPTPPPQPAPAPDDGPPAPPPWVWPMSAAVGWGVATVALALLLVKFPHATWPEQFGLVGGLFGVAVAGGWWVGLAAWAAARAAWLGLRVMELRRV